MNDKAATEEELLQSFADEAKRRCDVIAAGLATATTDFETMRAAAKALAEGAAAAAKGEEEPPDVGRSLAQLFSA